jgi:hypothetical protein
MYVCMYACMYVCIYLYMCIYTYIQVGSYQSKVGVLYVFICMSTKRHTHKKTHSHVFKDTHKNTHTHMYLSACREGGSRLKFFLFRYVCVCVYLCVYTHTHTHTCIYRYVCMYVPVKSWGLRVSYIPPGLCVSVRVCVSE